MRTFAIRSSWALAALLFVTMCGAQDLALLSPDQKVDGVTQEDWSRAWWQWAGAFDLQSSPIVDTTGALCASKQSGHVWFLAGAYGSARTTRTCRVPRDRYLFFPLINFIVMPPSTDGRSCESARREAAAMTQPIAKLVLAVDGTSYPDLERHRQATRNCFNMGARAEPRFDIYPSAANGYYVMLKPLRPGKHTLDFGGALPSMTQAVTYYLFVE